MHTTKKGITVGTKLKIKSVDAWYELCTLYKSQQHSDMDQATFLKSPVSGKVFMGSQSEQQSFSRRLNELNKGKLTSRYHLRQRKREFGDIEDHLVKYIELRENKYNNSKYIINWMTLCIKAQKYTEELGYSPVDFKASSEYIARVLSRHNKTSTSLHGEAADTTLEMVPLPRCDSRGEP